MKTRLIVPVLLSIVLVGPALGQSGPQIPADQAVRFGGKSGMVCGKVESAKYADKTEGQPTFLHMGAAFPRHTFAVKIMGEHRGKWATPPEELVGQLVCVIGDIKRAGATRAEMVIDSPGNMKLGVAK